MSDYPHVTAILAEVGLINTDWMKPEYVERGTAVHLATEYLDAGDLDFGSLDPIVVPFVETYQRFKQEVQPEIVSIEEKVVNEAYRYCGTLDRRVRINRREGVLDVKGICPFAWHRLQLSLYAGCFQGRALERWNLYLDPPNYKLVKHEDRDDWKVAIAALTLANFKRRFNV